MKINKDKLGDNYIVVIERKNPKNGKYDVIYAMDDEKPMWIHRNERVGYHFARISHSTFHKTIDSVQHSVEYLKSCYFTFNDRMCVFTMNVLKDRCRITYNKIIDDIDDFNFDYDII